MSSFSLSESITILANSSKYGFTIVLRWMMSKSISAAQIFLLNASLYFQLFVWHIPETSCLSWLPWEAESELEISTWWFIGGALKNTTWEGVISAGLHKERLNCVAAPTKTQSHRNLTTLQICSKLGQGSSDFIPQDLPTLGCRSPPGKGHNLEWKQVPLWQFPRWNSAMNHGSQFPRPLGKCISSRFISPWWLEVVAPANTVTSSLASCYPGTRSLK